MLQKKVGTGGMAELFKAKKIGIEGFERIVAIKRILPHLSADEEFIDMFIAEAKLAARLSHKNIVQIYDFGKIGQNYFIAMEYVPGKDLRTILRRCHTKNISLPPALAVYICKEVACALNCAHNQKDNNGKSLNIIHRDISPQNILISYDGEVKVVDFGIAKAESHSKTSTGVLKGKLSYMSPEQAWGKAIDQRSDLFSLGICLYEILTGEKLFKGDTEINTLEKVREARVYPLPSSFNTDISPTIEAKLLKALARDLGNRYQSASEMESDLGATLFEIAHFDPSTQLRQFMHELFQTEIEEEHWVDADQTVYVEDSKAYAPVSKSTRRDTRGTREKMDVVGSGPAKQRIYAYAGAALVAVMVVSGAIYYTFKPRNPPPDTAGSSQATHKQVQIPKHPEPPATANAPVPAINPPPVTPEPKPAPEPPPPQPTPQPVPKAVEAPHKGTMSISAKPWANVYVGGTSYGRTPQTIRDLSVGSHRVRLENPDFGSWEKTVSISKKGPANVKVHHEFGGFGTLVIQAKPWANIYVDGKHKGQTPITLDKVPSGEHQIRFVREGFVEITKTVTIKPGKNEPLSEPLQKKDN